MVEEDSNAFAADSKPVAGDHRKKRGVIHFRHRHYGSTFRFSPEQSSSGTVSSVAYRGDGSPRAISLWPCSFTTVSHQA